MLGNLVKDLKLKMGEGITVSSYTIVNRTAENQPNDIELPACDWSDG